MELYHLEQANKHVFHYLERDYVFNYKTGSMGSVAPPVRCTGTAFSVSNKTQSLTLNQVRDFGTQPYNDWVFLVRTKWLSSVVESSILVFNGWRYEIVGYDKVADGFLIDARSTKKPMTVSDETVTIVVEPEVSV